MCTHTQVAYDNTPATASWPEFFRERRLGPVVHMLEQSGFGLEDGREVLPFSLPHDSGLRPPTDLQWRALQASLMGSARAVVAALPSILAGADSFIPVLVTPPLCPHLRTSATFRRRKHFP